MPPEPRRRPSDRPTSQRWIKRPPRPSRPAEIVVAPRRQKPGWEPVLMSLGMGIACFIIAAVLIPLATQREGMVGLGAGLAFAAGFWILWKALGYRAQDLRDFVFK
jgi:hypothetical protein